MKLKVKTTGGKIASLVFLDIAQDCSSEQCLTSSKAGKKEKKKKKKGPHSFPYFVKRGKIN